MLYSQLKLNNQRSMQTIRTNTSIVESFEIRFNDFYDVVEVRRMLSRKSANRQYFIITLKSDVSNAERISNSTSLVKPLAEVVIRDKQAFFVFDIKEQHPKLKIFNEEICARVSCSIRFFIDSLCNLQGDYSSMMIVSK